MTDIKIALRGTLENTSDGEGIIATNAEAVAGNVNNRIATPASIRAFWTQTALPLVAPINQAIPAGGTTGQVLSKVSGNDYAVQWTTAGVGDMLKVTYDPQNKNGDAFALVNHTGTLPNTQITGLGTASTMDISAFVQPNATQTITNKRITLRVTSIATATTLTPNADTQDVCAVTAQASSLTVAQPTGTPTDGQQLTVRIHDNNATRSITWNAAYVGYSADLPTITVQNKTMYYVFAYNSATAVWELVTGNPIPGKWGG